MKTIRMPQTLALLALLFITLIAHPSSAQAQGTAFTYQGRLSESNAPANGIFEFEFTLRDSANGSNNLGVVTVEDVPVSHGLFTVTLDFGAGIFAGADRWLEIAIKTNGAVSFTPLAPPQPITAAPYALTAGSLNGELSSASLSGTYANAVTLNNAANSFSGNGANLTALNASQLTSGTVPSTALGNAWKIDGNAGTTPGAQFIGTVDNQPLELRANGTRALRIEPTTFSPHLIGGNAANSVSNGLLGATIAGGGNEFYPNQAGGSFAAIGGGLGNRADGTYATVAGGSFNRSGPSGATGGGNNNEATGFYSTVPGGELNRAEGSYSFAAGRRARAIHPGAFVWADSVGINFSSTANDQFLIRAGGGVGINTSDPAGAALAVSGDTTLAGDLMIHGGIHSTQALEFSLNLQRALRLEPNFTSPNLIGGAAANLISNGFFGAAILGGGSASSPNRVGNHHGTVLGGLGNTASGEAATVMGYSNTASGFAATAMGYATRASGGISTALGFATTASGYAATAIGYSNTASGISAIAAGFAATANGDFSTAIGYSAVASGNSSAALGHSTTASGDYSTALGFATTASGPLATAMGHRAQAKHASTFVWSDSTVADFSTTGDDQFLIHARGGVGINTNNPNGATLAVNGTVTASGTVGEAFEAHGAAAGYALLDRTTGAAGRWSMLANNGTLMFLSTGLPRLRVDAAGNVLANSFVPSSDRNAKRDFAPVNPAIMLDKVTRLEIQTWTFTDDPATRHIGPMAQDFYAAFNVGPDNKHIATVDADGVALAAIQGLNEKVEGRSQRAEDRMQKLEAENAELKARLGKLERLMNLDHGGTN